MGQHKLSLTTDTELSSSMWFWTQPVSFEHFFCPSLLFSGFSFSSHEIHTHLFCHGEMHMDAVFVCLFIHLSFFLLLPRCFLSTFSLCRSLLPMIACISHALLTAGRITARSSAGGGIRWPRTSPSCQTWCPPAALWHANQTSSPSCAWLCHTWSLSEEAAAAAPMEHINPPSSQTRSDINCTDHRKVFIPHRT